MKAQVFAACVAAFAFSASAKLEMGTPFADGMVLQRGIKVPVWGADLVVAADGVAEPVKVRYLFQRPWRGELYAKSGLPLGPFEVSK